MREPYNRIKFKAGDKIIWDKSSRLSFMIPEKEKELGEGPFTVQEVRNVDPDEQDSVRHSQFILAAEFPVDNYGPRWFSGAWFKLANEALRDPE